MSNPTIDPAQWNLASPTDRKASQIDASLTLATKHAKPIRLRRLLQELCHTQPDAHKVTGALLLATQKKYTEKIKASKGTQSDDDEEEGEEENEDEEDESESDGSSDVGEISELSSEEEGEEEDSEDD